MRIFIAVRHSPTPDRFYGDLWSANFYPALRRLGHELVASQIDLAPASAYMELANPADHPVARAARATVSEQLLAEVRQAHAQRPLDLFLSYFYNCHCDPGVIEAIRQLGIPTINYYCNSMYQFQLVAELAPVFDISWHAEMQAGPLYEAVGARPVWVQMAADPDLYRPKPTTEREASACFVGQRYCDRDRWLAALVRAGLPVAIYGRGWQPGPPSNGAVAAGPNRAGSTLWHRLQPYLRVARQNLAAEGPGGGLVRTLRQARYAREGRRLRALLQPFARGRADSLNAAFGRHELVLGFSNVWGDGRPGSSLIPHVRLRDFEAPMSRSCYLTGHTAEIEHFYAVGREIDTYRSEAELVDKTRFYLRHPEAAERLREAGYRRARQDHTWDQRFRQLFEAVNLPATA